MTAAELFNLNGRVALVTGASSGLGVRFAEVLAREGAPVALVGRRTDRLAALKTRIEAAGGRAIAIGADVLDRKAMTRAFDEAEKAFGTVTILVNNGGAIVNVASVLGFGVSKGTTAYAVAKAGVIQLTKALGLELAFKGVRVNAIAPGWIVTDLNRDYLMSEQGAAITREIPVGRFGEERDLDGALLLPPSDAGRYIAGAPIVVDAGQMVVLRGG